MYTSKFGVETTFVKAVIRRKAQFGPLDYDLKSLPVNKNKHKISDKFEFGLNLTTTFCSYISLERN